MILARGAFGKCPHNGQDIFRWARENIRVRVQRCIRCAFRARGHMCCTVAGHGEFHLWETKNPAGEGGASEKSAGLAVLGP